MVDYDFLEWFAGQGRFGGRHAAEQAARMGAGSESHLLAVLVQAARGDVADGEAP